MQAPLADGIRRKANMGHQHIKGNEWEAVLKDAEELAPME